MNPTTTRTRVLHIVADCSGSMCELGQKSALHTSIQSVLNFTERFRFFSSVRLWLLGRQLQQLSPSEWDGLLSCHGSCNIERVSDCCALLQPGDALLLLGDGCYDYEEASAARMALANCHASVAALLVGVTGNRYALQSLVGETNVFDAEDALPALCHLCAASDYVQELPNEQQLPAVGPQETEDEDEW